MRLVPECKVDFAHGKMSKDETTLSKLQKRNEQQLICGGDFGTR